MPPSSKATYKATWLCVFAMGCGGTGRGEESTTMCAQAAQSCFRGHLSTLWPAGHGAIVSGSRGSEAGSQLPPFCTVGSVDP